MSDDDKKQLNKLRVLRNTRFFSQEEGLFLIRIIDSETSRADHEKNVRELLEGYHRALERFDLIPVAMPDDPDPSEVEFYRRAWEASKEVKP